MLQNEEVKILWDFKIQINKHLANNIPCRYKSGWKEAGEVDWYDNIRR